MNGNINLFSYGTLQSENVQIAQFGRVLDGKPDVIVGFKQDLIEISDFEVISKSGKTQHPIVMTSDNPKDEVIGQVFEISKDELMQADLYEIDAYKRVEVELKSGTKAWVYVLA